MSPDPIAPSDYYTGLVANLYGYLRSSVFDPEPYASFVGRWGEPALELGCGDGDPMLDLRAKGLWVEGLDSSSDMLDRCRRAAQQRGLDVTLHHATFEAMDLDRRFRSIYFAGATFNLLADDETAQAALDRIAAHLEPDGAVLIPLFIPPVPATSDIGTIREHVTDDGAVMRLAVLDVVRDDAARTQTTAFRYELIEGDSHETALRSWQLHWFDQAHFAEMAARSGLAVRSVRGPQGQPATSEDPSFAFVLVPAPSSG